MAKDYVPAKDSDLRDFATNYLETIDGAETSFGLVEADATALGSLRTAYNNALDAFQAQQTTTRVARQTKDAAKIALVAKLRQLSKRVQATPTVSDAQRADLQITIPDRVPTAVSAPSSQPVLSVDFSKRREHRISAVDSATPNSKAKPAGAVGFGLWRKVQANQPADHTSMEFIGVISSGSHRLEFEESQIGQTAWYVARWMTATGKGSPFGSFESATIGK